MLSEAAKTSRVARLARLPFWPPNSPDLNPLDYYWSVERVTNKSQHPNVTSLRIAIETAFGMDSATLACVRILQIENRGHHLRANGGYIE